MLAPRRRRACCANPDRCGRDQRGPAPFWLNRRAGLPVKTDRLNAFTDGVVAIIITIMVLALPVPKAPGMAALKPELFLFGAYALAFIKVGIYWFQHHHLLQASRRVDGRVLL